MELSKNQQWYKLLNQGKVIKVAFSFVWLINKNMLQLFRRIVICISKGGNNYMLETFLNVVPITIIVGIIYVIYRIIKIKKNKLSVNYFYEIVKFIFVCYLTGLINLVLVPSNLWSHFWFYVKNGYSTGDSLGWFSGSFNFVPSLYKYLIKGELSIGTWIRDMLIGNMLMFIPMGIMLPLVFKNINKKNIFVIAILITLSIEILQPIVGRSFDIDDIIMNFIGSIIGYLAVTIFIKLKETNK